MIINAIAIANGGSGGSSKPPVLEELNVTDNGTYSPSTGVDGFNPVNVNVPIPTFTTEELSATANGEYTPTTDGYSKVTVAVPTPEPNLQAKETSQTITANGIIPITVRPDSGYDGLSSAKVTIRANVAASMPIVKFYDGETFKVGGNVDLSNWRAHMSCTQLTNLFAGNTKLTSIDVSNIWDGCFNASPMVNTHDISGMFSGCTFLTTIKINNWNFDSTDESVNMSNLFNGCSRLKTLEIKNFNEYAMPSIMTGMFSGCTALANIDFSGSSFLPTDMTWGLDKCPLSLASLVSLVDVLSDISSFGMSYSAGIGSTNLATLQNGNPDKYNEFIAKGWTA